MTVYTTKTYLPHNLGFTLSCAVNKDTLRHCIATQRIIGFSKFWAKQILDKIE